MEWEVLFFLILLFPLFFGNIYKIAIDFNFLEKNSFFFFFLFFFLVMTRFCFMAPYNKGVKQIPLCGLKWIFKLN